MTESKSDKLILPVELRVCATCSYWDGERRVDDDVKVVVVAENCAGECILREQALGGLTAAEKIRNCLWEQLGESCQGRDDPETR
ncbi:MAG: hypothetical protein HYU77_05880 [Betaproteobacteria bacterium]|nr:hypothetical protein [Betaproteobacteria bacterium]